MQRLCGDILKTESTETPTMRISQTSILLFAMLFAGGADLTARAQMTDLSFLLTRAERTDYAETTRYDELMGFLEVASAQTPRMHLTHFGYTVEGRSLPLVVFGDVADGSPGAVRASGKTRVYLQGNIHAGEVCGKEALLMLIRELGSGQHVEWADSLVLIIAPIYNADGNERVRLDNRPRQNGPLGGMGQRPNAQGLDLNRDHMKTASPEARSVVALMRDYDPHVSVDLHTTNGSRHAYHLTYAPPLNPNTPPAIDSLLREDWLPELTERMKSGHDWNTYYYGNLPYRAGTEGWYTFDHRPRFNNNYVGLRGRIAILSEAYAYDSFRNRVLSTNAFVDEILALTHREASTIQQLIARVDAEIITGKELAVRSELSMNRSSVTLLMGEVRETTHPYTGDMVLERLPVEIPRSMPEYGAFSPTETSTVPSAWIVPMSETAVIDRLNVHGIAYATREAAGLSVDAFRIDSLTTASREFQGVFEVEVHGAWSHTGNGPAGMVAVVPSAQPLGRLAHYLLDPRSDDGLANWGLLGEHLKVGEDYPVFRSHTP